MLDQSYNGWLRQENLSSRDTLQKTMESLQEQLLELQSALESATIMEPSRVFRANTAMVHLMTELLLLGITQEMQ